MVIDKIRVSIGSAAVLGLYQTHKFVVNPTTCYIMTYSQDKCIANCGFCPQSRDSSGSSELLSRVNWPLFKFIDFLAKLKSLTTPKKFKRICIQTLNYQNNFNDLIEIVLEIRKNSDVPISVAIPPMSKENLKELKLNGIDRVGIALDGATPLIFENVKGMGVHGPYNWNNHLQTLNNALEIFCRGFVTTHIIVGLGEVSRDVINLIEKVHGMGIRVSLFAFTPIKGTKFEHLNKPELLSFRKLQLGRHLIVNDIKNKNDFTFNLKGNIVKFNMDKKELRDIIHNSNAFFTSGCPGCNRPYYTSKPTGPTYNYPRALELNEKDEIYKNLLNYVN